MAVNKGDNDAIWQHLILSVCDLRGIKSLLPGNSNTKIVTLKIANSHDTGGT